MPSSPGDIRAGPEANPLFEVKGTVNDLVQLIQLQDPLEHVEDLLLVGHVGEDVWTSLKWLFAHLTENLMLSPDLRGAIGFALMTRLLEFASSEEGGRDAGLVEANCYFGDDAVAAAVRRVYGIPNDYDLLAGVIHRVGTTSFIVKCPAGSNRFLEKWAAVKCVIFRYLSIRSIATSTANYEEDFGRLNRHTPTVWESTNRFIAMEFEEGLTLAEVLRARRPAPDDSLDGDILRFLDCMSSSLCSVLDDLHSGGVAHMDLSPSNVIVRQSEGDKDEFDIALIDFGQNYLISERVGSSSAFRRAAVYVAPEILESSVPASWRADIYSLGIMLLESASGSTLNEDDVLPELANLWTRAPGLARTVEDMLDDNPENRLALIPTHLGDRPFEYLRVRLREELRVLERFVVRTGSSHAGTMRGLRLLDGKAEIAKLREVARDLADGADENYRYFGTLAKWATVSVACWYLTLLSFSFLTAADAGLYDLPAWATRAIEATNAHFVVGDFWGNLPGRLIPLTFALTAVTYYNNIFSTLSTRELDGFKAQASEFFMRSTAIGLYLAILYSMLYAPHAWALCSGLGTLLVVMNNLFVWRLALAAKQEVEDKNFSTYIDGGRAFANDFREWFSLMAAYSLTMSLIWVLLFFDVARDEAVYAYIICFVNVFKMYRLNCVLLAPYARGNIERTITTLRRAQSIDERRRPKGEGARPQATKNTVVLG